MSTYPLFRLMWRRGVIYDFVVTTLFAVVLSLMGAKIGLKLFGSLVDSEELNVAPASLDLHACLLTGAVIGVVVNFAMQGLLYNRFSWMLPNLRQSLQRDLWWFAVLSTLIGAALGLLLDIFHAGPGLLNGAAFGLLGFGLGNQQWDPKIGHNFCFLSQAALLLLILGAEFVAAWTAAMPWLLLPVALVVAYVSIQRCLQTNGLRKRALVPIDQLGASFEQAQRTETAAIAKKNLRNGAKLWSHGLIRNQDDQLRALFYEQFGWAKGLWRGVTIRAAAAMAILVMVLSVGIYSMAGVDDKGAAIGLTVGCLVGPLVFLVFTRISWNRGILYPMSRQQRAELLWRANARKGISTLFITIVVILVPHLVLAVWTQQFTLLENLDIVLAAVMSFGVFIPLSQWVHMRWIDRQLLSANSPSFVLILTLILTGFMLAFNLLMMALMEASPVTLGLLAVIALPMIWIAAQWFFRRQLQQLMATMDL